MKILNTAETQSHYKRAPSIYRIFSHKRLGVYYFVPVFPPALIISFYVSVENFQKFWPKRAFDNCDIPLQFCLYGVSDHSKELTTKVNRKAQPCSARGNVILTKRSSKL